MMSTINPIFISLCRKLGEQYRFAPIFSCFLPYIPISQYQPPWSTAPFFPQQEQFFPVYRRQD
jgi:hypothetical protein